MSFIEGGSRHHVAQFYRESATQRRWIETPVDRMNGMPGSNEHMIA